MKQKRTNRILAALLAAAMMFQMLPLMVFAADGDEAGSAVAEKVKVGETEYDTLLEAVTAAPADGSTTTITLGEGNYTLYNTAVTTGKNLTFVGQGTDQTFWNIGGTKYDRDYSFDGAGTITFENMTLRSGTADYLGFIRSQNTVVENCVINGKTTYWGYTSATFVDTTFDAPSGDYAIWVYSSPKVTFERCTFNTAGKAVKLYNEGGTDITVEFKDCTVMTRGKYNKPAINIDDTYSSFVVKISGQNNIDAKREDATCSKLFGFGSNNKGKTEVYIDDTLVWGPNEDATKGELKDHKHSDGEKDGKVTVTTGDWQKDEENARYTREVSWECGYCGRDGKDTEYGYEVAYELDGGTAGEGADYTAKIYPEGEKAALAAAPAKEGYEFKGWKAADQQYSAGDEITVSANTTLTAQWEKKEDPTPEKPDPEPEQPAPEEPAAAGSGDDAVAVAVAVTAGVAGASVVGYYLGTEVLVHVLGMPYLPKNRSELALMLWENAGKPMPQSAQLYTDVGDDEQAMDLQYAARWAVEQDLVPELDGEQEKFDPELGVGRIRALRAWIKAQALK